MAMPSPLPQMAERICISPGFAAVLERHRLSGFHTFMHEAVGSELSRDREREVRMISLAEEGAELRFFLKRRHRESWLGTFSTLLRGRPPLSGPLRERLLVQSLRKAGFAAMEPAAWGQRSVLGVPVCGFILVVGIPGISVAEAFERSAGRRRLDLMERIGLLVGALHRKGFLHPVRLKDLILRERDGELVLIDRESRKPWRSSYSSRKGIRSIARAARRTLRDGHRIGPGSASAFVRGYLRSVGCGEGAARRAWVRALAGQLRLELGGSGKTGAG